MDFADTVIPARYAELARLVWNMDPSRPIPAEDAFALYEANWRNVEAGSLSEQERRLIGVLVQRFGSGHLLSAEGDDRFGSPVSDPAATIAEYGGAASYGRPEHNAVASALKAMDHDLLVACKCWFGGGTEIVLDLGKYRQSTDLSFFCSEADGYREMRTRAMSDGAHGIFGEGVRERRAFKADRYGIRGIVIS